MALPKLVLMVVGEISVISLDQSLPQVPAIAVLYDFTVLSLMLRETQYSLNSSSIVLAWL